MCESKGPIQGLAQDRRRGRSFLRCPGADKIHSNGGCRVCSVPTRASGGSDSHSGQNTRIPRTRRALGTRGPVPRSLGWIDTRQRMEENNTRKRMQGKDTQYHSRPRGYMGFQDNIPP